MLLIFVKHYTMSSLILKCIPCNLLIICWFHLSCHCFKLYFATANLNQYMECKNWIFDYPTSPLVFWSTTLFSCIHCSTQFPNERVCSSQLVQKFYWAIANTSVIDFDHPRGIPYKLRNLIGQVQFHLCTGSDCVLCVLKHVLYPQREK
jgi:hypothetical protein